MKSICVIGTGYVGLVTGTCFADLGNDVVCVDIDARKIEMLREGVMPIYEPGVEELVRRNVAAGRLTFTTDYTEGVPNADFVFICVDTPSGAGGEADLKYMRSAAQGIADVMTKPLIIVNRSTVPIGTGDFVTEVVKARLKRDIPFAVVSNPEFTAEGTAVWDFMHPDRVVLGSSSRQAAEAVAQLYLTLRAPIMITDQRTSEMIKYASNAYLASRISFINQIATICEQMGADVGEVATGMGYDKRIGKAFLNAGIGWGGSCFEGDETVFTLNSPNVATETLETLFTRSGQPFQGDVVQVVAPPDQRVLAFDLNTGQPTLASVQAITRRPYQGTMVNLSTSMGRNLRVTADHPVILHTPRGFDVVPAATVAPGDQMMALLDLPPVEPAQSLNLIDRLRGTALADDVNVAATDQSFVEQYSQFAPHIPTEMLRYPQEIKRRNRMPLRVYLHLRDLGVLDVPAERLQLYTGTGGTTRINAVVPIDADLLRLCGYYVAEGYLSYDFGRAGARRERVGFSFHENETEYITDVQRILTGMGLKFITRHSTHALTTLVSSRIFGWLIRDVLRCGTRSDDKALPRLAFNVDPSLRFELLRGAFSGDGAVTPVQQGKNLMLEYATVSKPLADGLTLLLQSVGVVPSIRTRWMNKSKQPAYILRVSGYAQLDRLQGVFGEKHRARIAGVLASYQRQIKQRGFTSAGPYATLTVQDVKHETVDTVVYSLETSTGTAIASSGLIVHNCFPKDVKALEYMASVHGAHPQLLRDVIEINRDMRRRVVQRVRQLVGKLNGATVGILGLAFKPNTDDMREAPSVEIIRLLQNEGAHIRAYDPVAMKNAERILRDVTLCEDAYQVAEGCDALVIVTEWNEFKQLDIKRLKDLMRLPILVDGRNIYDPTRLRDHGFIYRGIGRGYAGGESTTEQNNGRATPQEAKTGP